nr:integrase, catalytic region, zinc finger, CCHC-type, peptidase aspartic, catalytic [Tanacetum cinerariifolium]
MTRDRSQLINFVQKFLGTVKFENDHVAKIMGYGDYRIGNVTISRVYFLEGLGHNLFSVGQFCDSDLEDSAYLNELESTLDDGIYTMMVVNSVEEEKKAKVDDVMDIIINTKENAEVKQENVVFSKAPYREYDEPFMRFSTPCEVERNEAIVDYVNEGEPSIVFGMSFLLTTNSQVDFELGEIRINITMLRINNDVDALLKNLLKNMVDISDASGERVKIGKATRLKNYIINKRTPPAPPKTDEIPKSSSTPSQSIFHQLSPQQKEKIIEALLRKYQELTEKKPIVEVLENYMMYHKKLDEVLMGRARLKNKDHTKEDRDKILENGFPKKMCDSRNFVLYVRVNGIISLSALADARYNNS